MSATSYPMRTPYTRRRMKKVREQALADQPVMLSFETQRVIAAKQAMPVDRIVMEASETEHLSFQPTVRVEIKRYSPGLERGETLMNRVGKHDFFKTQAYMLVAISVMGLLIGFFIAYFI
ncbi:MAG: hypothetical protein M0P11_04940 [Anaerolineaceae bacterium]|nr:hypothetical protein [Anaerolineaceae bacterium]